MERILVTVERDLFGNPVPLRVVETTEHGVGLLKEELEITQASQLFGNGDGVYEVIWESTGVTSRLAESVYEDIV